MMTNTSNAVEYFSKRCRFLVELTVDSITLTLQKQMDIMSGITDHGEIDERLSDIAGMHREISKLMIPKKVGGEIGEQVVQQKRKQKRR